ncbi:MAG TPA: T9SS type A sorting domain-containing protein, partial [Flavobacterium sp.]|nr:T9SS type A sorting domain-containing protein [Flavobacterium sp.]
IAAHLDVNTVLAPTGLAIQTVNGDVAADATIEDIEVTGANIVWYASSDDALAGTNPLAAGTQVVNGNSYYAMQTVDGCSSIAPLGVTVTVNLATNSFEMAGLQYYPNPVADVFTMKYKANITTVEVYNIVGQLVISAHPNAATTSLNMGALPAGSYIVKVKANNEAKTIKVLKQ